MPTKETQEAYDAMAQAKHSAPSSSFVSAEARQNTHNYVNGKVLTAILAELVALREDVQKALESKRD